MDLPKTAPKRKEIDIYIDQKNQIEPTIKRIKNKIQERVIIRILYRKSLRFLAYKAESVNLDECLHSFFRNDDDESPLIEPSISINLNQFITSDFVFHQPFHFSKRKNVCVMCTLTL